MYTSHITSVLHDHSYQLYSDDLFTEGSDNSDDEALLSLLKRSKNMQDERGRQEVPNLKIDGKLLKDASDDEFLSFVLEKIARVLPNTKNVKLTTTSIKQTTVENDSGYGDAQDLIERDGFEQPTEMAAAEINDVTFDHAGNTEAEASDSTVLIISVLLARVSKAKFKIINVVHKRMIQMVAVFHNDLGNIRQQVLQQQHLPSPPQMHQILWP